MRRKDREITDMQEQLGIIARSKVCRLAMAAGDQPYVVPLNFAYAYQNGELTFYFHSAREGKKIAILRENPSVCLELDGGHALLAGERACSFGYAYESLIGFGRVEFVEEEAEKAAALQLLMRQQSGEDRDFVFEDRELKAVQVYKVRLQSLTGKRRALQ